jgi:hypothetical protein
MGDRTHLAVRACESERTAAGITPGARGDHARPAWWGWATLGVALAPALAAIWCVPCFVTQDGPAHLYNAQILAWSFDRSSPFRDVYTVTWEPIPNWAGHLVLAGLVAVLPAWLADRIITSLTLAGFAASILWLRWRVCGRRGLVAAALLSALLSMNLAWVLGFTSFLLGACLFPITLGLWWSERDRLDVLRIPILIVLTVLGYFCHVVSAGLTAVGLLVLSLTAPVALDRGGGWGVRMSRLGRTSLALVPLGLLCASYMRLARGRGPLRPIWENLSGPFSPGAWVDRLGWVDPITLAIKDGLPLTSQSSHVFAVFAPAVWLAIGLALWWYCRMTGRTRATATETEGARRAGEPELAAVRSNGCHESRAGWLLVAALLIIGGVGGPDSFGAAHGEFLPQRLVLLGLVALVPVFDIDTSRWAGRATLASVALALALQLVIVWDYALYCDQTAGQIIRAGPAVGRFQRIATLLVTTRSRFRTNPLLHAEDWLGVDTGNIVWNNYETMHYYFPVHFHAELDRPHPSELEHMSIREDPADAGSRVRAWEKILARHARSIDVLLVWKSDPGLDAVTARHFDSVERRDDLRIFRRRPLAGPNEDGLPRLDERSKERPALEWSF